jgi:hypothetical protein
MQPKPFLVIIRALDPPYVRHIHLWLSHQSGIIKQLDYNCHAPMARARHQVSDFQIVLGWYFEKFFQPLYKPHICNYFLGIFFRPRISQFFSALSRTTLAGMSGICQVVGHRSRPRGGEGGASTTLSCQKNVKLFVTTLYILITYTIY